MSSFSRQFSSDSPVLALSPTASHQPPLAAPSFPPQHIQLPMPNEIPAVPIEPSKTARKRSRDEAAINLEPDLPPPEPIESTEDWIYGEGMVLIKPNTHYIPDASTQSGTWVEETAATEEETLRQQQEDLKATIRNHKSQRLDVGPNGTPPPEFLTRPLPGMPVVSPKSPGPVIDDYTFHLGIGWRKISDEDHIQAAARGWAKYIENHYPLTDVQIRLESKGLQSYLVECLQGYFLFSEDLHQARLVSRDIEQTFRNLQNTPPTFDGADPLLASEDATPANSDGPAPNDTEMKMD